MGSVLWGANKALPWLDGIEFEIAKNEAIVLVVYEHGVFCLMRQVDNIALPNGKCSTVVKLIGAGARYNVNERIAVSAIYLQKLVVIAVLGSYYVYQLVYI